MSKNAQPFNQNGVFISKTDINIGDKVTLTYEGLLAQSGADSIFAHVGYGDLWEEKAFVPMEAVNGVFTAAIKVTHPSSLNISFKDGAENWDNNSGQNYSFKVSAKAKETKKAEPAKKAAVKKEVAKPAKATKVEEVKKVEKKKKA